MALTNDPDKFSDFLTKYKNKETDIIPEDYSDTDDFILDSFINDETNWQEDPTLQDFVNHDLESDKEAALDKSDYDTDSTSNDSDDWLDELFNTDDTEDVNNDGDMDVSYTDTDGDGDVDIAKVEADTQKEAVKSLSKATDKVASEETTTGKSKKELETDDTQKNIADALKDLNF